ncbi:hypothetical protein PVAND_002155 [Polypedilum vanderplanki]|uniref:Cilia- and flagella-associated protein 157 n=1 Tax=Polypedilum vanderplanki TaxID=319348 RepID=A0A9J6BQF8_POLVA|nr:hypothetical protein PVAND_002155 [Polypedilum vanderplanki]
MPPKEKKGKKTKKEEEDQENSDLTAVDKQFYELTIADINKKLTRLRAHNVKIEEKNEELEMRMKQMEEDRQDVTAFLNRTLKEKVSTIQELEDKLTELKKVRHEENENFKKKNLEWENKYKMMHDNLQSEIKLLTGKLNSMEEFRLQRDDLIAKFDAQDFELKDQAKKHKAILYEMERKVILDKERMRKDVENKLLELSNEFTKTSDLRIAASTQRLVRENIALNNDMDRILVMQSRLQRENEEMAKKHKEIIGQYDANVLEKKRLIKTCEQQLEIIKKLTKESEDAKNLNNYLLEIKRSHEVARRMTRDNKGELNDVCQKVQALEQQIHTLEFDRQQLKRDAQFYQAEYSKSLKVIDTIRLTVKSAIRSEKEDKTKHDPAFYEAKRSNLLVDLMNILDTKDYHDGSSSSSSFYSHGDLGLLLKIQNDDSISKMTVSSSIIIHSMKSEAEYDPVVDPASGSLSYFANLDEAASSEGSNDAKFEVTEQPQTATLQRKSTKMLSIDLRQSLDETKDKESIISEKEIDIGEEVEQKDEDESEEEEEFEIEHEEEQEHEDGN